jgi:hypothetical protein
MSAGLIALISFGLFVLLFLFYAFSVRSHYDRLPVCGRCKHKLEREDITKENDEGKKIKIGSREFCPDCRAKDYRMAGWYYGYVPKGSRFAE